MNGLIKFLLPLGFLVLAAVGYNYARGNTQAPAVKALNLHAAHSKFNTSRSTPLQLLENAEHLQEEDTGFSDHLLLKGCILISLLFGISFAQFCRFQQKSLPGFRHLYAILSTSYLRFRVFLI